jgi:hypothetical protein
MALLWTWYRRKQRATSWDCLYQLSIVVIQSSSDIPDTLYKCAIRDIGPSPHRINQLFFRYHASMVFHEVTQDIERPRAQFYFVVELRERAFLWIEREAREANAD